MAPIGCPPASYVETRTGLHHVATHVLTPARYRVTGRIGLRATPGGFGTPVFGDDRQVRVEGADLVVTSGQSETIAPLATLRGASELAFAGPPDLQWASDLDLHDPPPAHDPDAPLGIDVESAAFLGAWFALGWSALEALRADAESVDASEPQLWPEHFDPAIEAGSDDAHRRAGYGFSPGDGAIAEPYAYVTLWYGDEAPSSDLWNAESFAGAVLPVSEFADEPDPEAFVVRWLRTRRDVLAT